MTVRPARGERSLSMAEGTPLPCGSVFIIPSYPLKSEKHISNVCYVLFMFSNARDMTQFSMTTMPGNRSNHGNPKCKQNDTPNDPILTILFFLIISKFKESFKFP